MIKKVGPPNPNLKPKRIKLSRKERRKKTLKRDPPKPSLGPTFLRPHLSLISFSKAPNSKPIRVHVAQAFGSDLGSCSSPTRTPSTTQSATFFILPSLLLVLLTEKKRKLSAFRLFLWSGDHADDSSK